MLGVFLSDRPVGENEGAKPSEAVLEVTLNKIEVSDYELVEEGKPYREFMIPASIVNKKGKIRKVNKN